jgi:hypothetical protein
MVSPHPSQVGATDNHPRNHCDCYQQATDDDRCQPETSSDEPAVSQTEQSEGDSEEVERYGPGRGVHTGILGGAESLINGQYLNHSSANPNNQRLMANPGEG